MNRPDDRLAALLDLASAEPALRYRWRGAPPRGASPAPTDRVVAEYFESHPAEYVDELSAFYRLNAGVEDASKRVFVFVVCYNELANLPRIVEHYAGQQQFDLAGLQLTFLVNHTSRNDADKNAADERTFQRSLARLLALKEEHGFIHVVGKRFSSATGGLARARKYAMDYALLSCLRSRCDPAAAVLISNEGDTLELPADYLRAWTARFATDPERLVQGNIVYPASVTRAPLLSLYTHVRERVHLGQGLYDRRYPFYEGIMPTGRNYAVHPKVACLAGGIDPVALPSAEDDLTFGSDVHNLVGPEAKVFAEDIALTTHPRREIVITRDLLMGRPDDAKKVYENFHKVTDIYDIEWEQYLGVVDAIGQFADSVENRCTVVNQFYQWVFRTVMKNYFAVDPRFREIFELGRSHQIGYWERENRLWQVYTERMEELPMFDRVRFLTRVVDESLAWFNELVALPRRFEEASVGLDTRLSR